MIIPVFKEPTIPVFEMEFYINSEATENARQFERVLDAVMEFATYPKTSEMTAILEYKDKAFDYCVKLGITALDSFDFAHADFITLYNAVNDNEFYKRALKDKILFVKYCTLQQVLNEIRIINLIIQEVKLLDDKLNRPDERIISYLDELVKK